MIVTTTPTESFNKLIHVSISDKIGQMRCMKCYQCDKTRGTFGGVTVSFHMSLFV